MKTILAISLLLPLTLFAKFVKQIQLYNPPRSAFVDDEVVYIVTTTVCKYPEARFDPEQGHFVDARSKRVLAFADGERITKLDRLGGIGTGGTITGYATLEIRQGTVSLSYPFDAEIGTAEVCSNLLAAAVDGDRLHFSSSGTNCSFVASFYPKDNALHWLNPVTFEMCETLPPPDHDREVRYSRMQRTNSTVAICGGRLQKDIGIIKFSEYDIDEVYRIVENAGPENAIDENNLLYKDPARNSKPDGASVLTPRKFYVVLKDGRRAFGMFQPDIENRPVLYSPITYVSLGVAKDDIATFEPIDDGAFPIPECYSKNEVEELYKLYTNPAGGDTIKPKPQAFLIWLPLVALGLNWVIPLFLKQQEDAICVWVIKHPKLRLLMLIALLLLFAIVSHYSG